MEAAGFRGRVDVELGGFGWAEVSWVAIEEEGCARTVDSSLLDLAVSSGIAAGIVLSFSSSVAFGPDFLDFVVVSLDSDVTCLCTVAVLLLFGSSSLVPEAVLLRSGGAINLFAVTALSFSVSLSLVVITSASSAPSSLDATLAEPVISLRFQSSVAMFVISDIVLRFNPRRVGSNTTRFRLREVIAGLVSIFAKSRFDTSRACADVGDSVESDLLLGVCGALSGCLS